MKIENETELEKIWNKIPIESRKHIHMYITARQFKNAVLINEMLTVPALSNNLPENTEISFGGLITAKASGNKIVSKFFPFMVNKSFSCEIYLKYILTESNINFKDLKGKKGHDLWLLYDRLFTNNSNINDMFIEYINKYTKSIIDIEKEIKDISNVFESWRYIYEKYDEAQQINHGFLDMFCNFLDVYCMAIIKTKYNYDINKDIR